MKKIMLSVVMLFFFAVAAKAQAPVQFGLKAGANLATLTNNANMDVDHRTGFHAGALAHIHLGSSFALQPEVMFSAQGAEYTNNRRDKINYVNVPVLGQYMIGKGLR
ncbi:MAG: PorT family protein, partial [Bacteroidota bacterium]|nr:PorT family protein [Bacteroidota bacterium]